MMQRWQAASGGALALWLGVASTAAQAIVGPSEAPGPVAASMLMVLSRQGASAGFCSATVMRQDVLLTAGHCVPPGADIKAHYRDEAGHPVLLDVAAIERSPDFHADAVKTRQRSIDLALVRLAVPLPAPYRPAVFGDRAGAAVGDAFHLAGFGLRREREASSSGVLRLADVAAGLPLSNVLLWSRDPQGRGAGACTGDSGGPVLAPDGAVVAVIAWAAGKGSAHCGDLTQAVWIAPHKAWIDAVLARWR